MIGSHAHFRSANKWLAIWLPRLLIVCLTLHFLQGVLPFAPVEGDEQGVLNGLQAWARATHDFEAASYLYPIQPGSYLLIHGLHCVTGGTQLQVFGLLSALSAAGFIFFASLLLARAAGLRPAWVAVALLMTQELTAGACYANTNSIAGVVVMAALVLAQAARARPALWLAGGLIGLGGWLRMDSLLLSPVVLVLRLNHSPPRRAITETVEVAVISGLTLAAAFALSGLSLLSAWQSFSRRENFASWQMLTVNGWLVLGFCATGSAAVGSLWLAWRRRWFLFGLVVAGVGMSTLVYGGSFTTPKYLYYAAPFLLLPILAWLAELWSNQSRPSPWKRGLAAGVIALHLAEALVGVQTSSAQFRRFDPEPLRLVFAQIQFGLKDIRVGLGEGEILPTDDGHRLRGGQFWAPSVWHREKSGMQAELARLDLALQSGSFDVVITSTYLSFRLVDGWLREHGFVAGSSQPFVGNSTSHLTTWQSPQGRLIRLALVNHTSRDQTEFTASANLSQRVLFVCDRGGIESRYLADKSGTWLLLSPRENGLIALYSRASVDVRPPARALIGEGPATHFPMGEPILEPARAAVRRPHQTQPGHSVPDLL